MSSTAPAESLLSHDCSVVLHRYAGPQRDELFFSCRPSGRGSAGDQATRAWRAIQDVLRGASASYAHVTTETVFLRRQADIDDIRAGRGRALDGSGALTDQPTRTEIEQPPLHDGASLEVLVHAVLATATPLQVDTIAAATGCACAECQRAHGLRVTQGTETQLFAGGLYGAGAGAYEQTQAMFEAAEKLVLDAGMSFSDVMRTWIHFPDMERDYADFNRARRDFFASRQIEPIPASTGIGADLVAPQHAVCLGIYAVKGDPPTERIVMTTPTLNEAPEYGSDFSRGMRVEEANKVSLLVSGTASIDENGETVCVDDFQGQVRRMLRNVEGLLQAQGAGFSDVVSAITYLKRPDDADRLRAAFEAAGYVGFPHAIVTAEVCRPELLCETELLALLPVLHA